MHPARLFAALLTIAALAAAPTRSAAQATPRTIPVRLSEFRVEMPDSVQQGQVVLAVTNAGTAPHSFRIRGHRSQVSTRTLAPGQTVNVAMRLIVGEYMAYCAEKSSSGEEHRKMGMEHRVRVIW